MPDFDDNCAMSTKNLLTLIGGILACAGPILMMSSNEDFRTVGLVCNAIAGLLLGTRGLPGVQPEEPAPTPALQQEVERRIAPEVPPIVVVPRTLRESSPFIPGQPWLPAPTKSKEELRAEQDAWLERIRNQAKTE
jgi:hypothetical protein